MNGIGDEESLHRKETCQGEGGKEGVGKGSKDQLSLLANTLSSTLNHSAPYTTQTTTTQADLLSVGSSPVKAADLFSDPIIDGLTRKLECFLYMHDLSLHLLL